MGNAGKKKARRRRRERYFALHALENEDKDISDIVDLARRHSRAANNKANQEYQADAVTEIATKTADDVTELYMTELPAKVVATDLVKALHTALYSKDLIPMEYVLRVSYTSDPFPESPILRCEVRLPKDVKRLPVAYVSVRSATLADQILQCSPLDILGKSVPIVLCKRPLLPGAGSAWRSRRDPGTISWKVGMIQFGEKVTDELFSTFWASSQFFDLSENCHLELNPVERILALTIGSPQRIWKSSSIYSEFEEIDSLLRIEVHFQSISGVPFVERNPGSKQDCAVYFPISRPPLIFRVEDSSFLMDPYAHRNLLWDCSQDAFESVRWVRTIDPSRNGAFSRSRGFRVMLGSNDMQALFERLHRMCVVSTPTPYPVPGRHEVERHCPDRHLKFVRATKKYNVSFRLRYMVECILSLNSISISYITDEFWKTLVGGVSEEDALAALDLMYFRLSELDLIFRRESDVSSLITDPVALLDECIRLCKVRGVSPDVDLDGNFQHDSSYGEISNQSDQSDDFTRNEPYHQLSISGFDPTGSYMPLPENFSDGMDGSLAKLRLPSRQHALIRRLLFTPTRVIAQLPETDLLNRVLREFAVHHDRFLRITFCDEDGGSIGFTGSDDLYTRIRKALRDGVYAAGEKFVFLAFSNSQLRDHAVWVYNETPDKNRRAGEPMPPTADQIRNWMGDFSRILIPGK